MKIIGFSQLRNELSKGNLENWFKCMNVCDYIYIFDQNSDDGSKEYYKQFPNCVVIENPINDFENELICKNTLIERIQKDHPDADWIYWLDGDTLSPGGLETKENVHALLNSIPENIDGVDMGHYNLWRSDIHYRIDDMYDYFDNVGRTPFWRNKLNMGWPDKKGMHQPENERPSEIKNRIRINLALVHRGFATDQQIIEKYLLYKKNGQEEKYTAWAMNRFIDESKLVTKVLNKSKLPKWFKIIDVVDPKEKTPLVEIAKPYGIEIIQQK
jgi:hypothetical protein